VRPGSLYVEWVLRTEGARRLRNVRFRTPVILSGGDALIGVSVTDNRHCAFHDAGVVAELEIEPGTPARPPPAAVSGEGFQPVAGFYTLS